MNLQSVASRLFNEDEICDEEYQILISKMSSDLEEETDRVKLITELLFGGFITPSEGTELLRPFSEKSALSYELDDAEYYSKMFPEQKQVIEINGERYPVTYKFQPVEFSKT